jgi:predicted enzyme related to lactoylglutathione lyase
MEVRMSERTEYSPGTPSWIDLGSPDPDASAAFYGGLFGWSAEVDPRPEAGGYRMCTLRGKSVAGLGPSMNPDAPPYWSVYITVADADATVARAEIHNGTIVVPPMDVLDVGRMAVLEDTNGAHISVWQPRSHAGAELVNEHGTFVWNELAVPDVRRAHEFYTAVFDWEVDPEMSTETALYFNVDGALVCGGHVAEGGEPSGWTVWFAVDDTDAAAAKATELGGTLAMPPTDMSFGRAALVADLHGAMFGIAKMAAEPESPA